MSTPMTGDQVRWARRHDWFLRTNGRTVTVLDRTIDKSGAAHEAEIEFASFRKLREWAGY